MEYKIRRLSPQAIEVRCKYKKGFRQQFLLTSDHHFDSKHCNRDMLEKHHKEAQSRGAGIFAFGDVLDVMQGKTDRRHVKDSIREEYLGGNYYDLVVSDAVEWYAPYASNYIAMTYGNHETAIRKHLETDVLQRLVSRINERTGAAIQVGNYEGYIVFRFEHEGGGNIKTFTLKYLHGSGGGAPVTKGVIKTNRRAVSFPDANIIVSGHVHNRWLFDTPRERLLRNGAAAIDTLTHIQLPAYKEEHLKGQGWHVEREGGPRLNGGAWLTFDVVSDRVEWNVVWAD